MYVARVNAKYTIGAEYSMSGFEVRKVRIVDSTAKSRGGSSKRRNCGGEFDGDEGIDEFVEVMEDS